MAAQFKAMVDLRSVSLALNPLHKSYLVMHRGRFRYKAGQLSLTRGRLKIAPTTVLQSSVDGAI